MNGVKIKKRKEKLDKLLLERGLASSRERAKGLIMAGSVWVGERKVTKVGAEFPVDIAVEVKESPLGKYVSQGRIEAGSSNKGVRFER